MCLFFPDEKPSTEELRSKQISMTERQGRLRQKRHENENERLTNQDHFNTVVITSAVTAVATLRYGSKTVVVVCCIENSRFLLASQKHLI